MNAVEFLFALFAVFGSTAAWFTWISFVYKVEKLSDEKGLQLENKEETLN